MPMTQGWRLSSGAGIEAVALDMWKPYLQSTLGHVPAAAEKIVFDRFHIMGHMGKAVDTGPQARTPSPESGGMNRKFVQWMIPFRFVRRVSPSQSLLLRPKQGHSRQTAL